MGTTLTGTTPQDTYDSLIKVTDNGPLSGTLKALSDGLGNDSTLSLSTTAASIAGTLAVTGNATFDTNTLFVDAASNEVGIGTTSPSGKLHISATSGVASLGSTALAIRDSVASNYGFDFTLEGVSSGDMSLVRTELDVQSQVMTFKRSNGNVGIGTSAPNFILEAAGTTGIGVRSTGVDGVYTDILSSVYSGNANEQNAIQASVSGVASDSGFRFQVSNGSGLSTQTVGYQLNKDRHIFYANGTERVRVTTDGLTFNGDTAAANALDDYEEGTWTMGVSFGGASVGVTTSQNTGTYTKIGRQVTVNGYLLLTSKGSSTGAARITGLPFTVPNNAANYATAALYLDAVTFTNQFQGICVINNTTISLEEVTVLGISSALTNADFANTSGIIVGLTYFV